jgi:hypothetical protein
MKQFGISEFIWELICLCWNLEKSHFSTNCAERTQNMVLCSACVYRVMRLQISCRRKCFTSWEFIFRNSHNTEFPFISTCFVLQAERRWLRYVGFGVFPTTADLIRPWEAVYLLGKHGRLCRLCGALTCASLHCYYGWAELAAPTSNFVLVLWQTCCAQRLSCNCMLAGTNKTQ